MDDTLTVIARSASGFALAMAAKHTEGVGEISISPTPSVVVRYRGATEAIALR
jgi:hypothetical protein